MPGIRLINSERAFGKVVFTNSIHRKAVGESVRVPELLVQVNDSRRANRSLNHPLSSEDSSLGVEVNRRGDTLSCHHVGARKCLYFPCLERAVKVVKPFRIKA